MGDERIRVLIADDDARVRQALRALLEPEADLTLVGEAGTADETLAQARALQPGVILLDLLLPDRGTVLTLLPTLAAWPVVAISVRGGLRDVALRAGAVAFVEKGAAPEAMLAAIRLVRVG